MSDAGSPPIDPPISARVARLVPGRSSASWALLDQAVVSGASFVTSIIIARFLGPDEFGRFILAMAVVFVSQNLHGALITGPIMTIGSSWRGSSGSLYLGAVLLHQLAFSGLAALLGYLVLHLADGLVPNWKLGQLAVPVALLIAAGSAADMIRHVHYAWGRAYESFVLDSVRFSAQVVGTLLLILTGAGTVAGVATVMAVAGLLATAISWVVIASAHIKRAVLVDVTQQHWNFSRWLLATTSVVAGREAVTNTTVGAMLGLSELAFLRAAQQIVLAINVPLQGLGKIAQTGASKAFADGSRAQLDRYLRRFVGRYTALLAMLLIVMATSSESITGAIYGPEYAGASWVLSAFALIMLLQLGREWLAIRMRAMRLPSMDFYGAVGGAAVALAAVVPLTLWLGLTGVLLAEFFFFAVSFGITLYLARLSEGRAVSQERDDDAARRRSTSA